VNLFKRVLGWRKRKCKIAREGLQNSQRGVAKKPERGCKIATDGLQSSQRGV